MSTFEFLTKNATRYFLPITIVILNFIYNLRRDKRLQKVEEKTYFENIQKEKHAILISNLHKICLQVQMMVVEKSLCDNKLEENKIFVDAKDLIKIYQANIAETLYFFENRHVEKIYDFFELLTGVLPSCKKSYELKNVELPDYSMLPLKLIEIENLFKVTTIEKREPSEMSTFVACCGRASRTPDKFQKSSNTILEVTDETDRGNNGIC